MYYTNVFIRCVICRHHSHNTWLVTSNSWLLILDSRLFCGMLNIDFCFLIHLSQPFLIFHDFHPQSLIINLINREKSMSMSWKLKALAFFVFSLALNYDAVTFDMFKNKIRYFFFSKSKLKDIGNWTGKRTKCA